MGIFTLLTEVRVKQGWSEIQSTILMQIFLSSQSHSAESSIIFQVYSGMLLDGKFVRISLLVLFLSYDDWTIACTLIFFIRNLTLGWVLEFLNHDRPLSTQSFLEFLRSVWIESNLHRKKNGIWNFSTYIKIFFNTEIGRY